MTAQVFHLSAEDINCSPGWLVSKQEPDTGFVSTISKFGVAQPVLVTQRDSAWLLVCGWKRVQACRSLGLSIPCLAVTADDLACAEISLHCNAEQVRSGPMALTWARYIYSRLSKEEAGEFCASSLQPLLGTRVWRCLQAWMGLDRDWDELIAREQVPFELGPVLAARGPRESRDFLPLFSHSAWSLNKAKQVVTWIAELGKKKDRSVHELLKEMEILDILDRDLSPKDAQQAVVHQIRRARFPALSRLEHEFARLQKEVAGKTGWRIEPEQHFETNGLIIQARIRSQAEAERVLAELESIIQSSALDRIWSWQERELDGRK
ncbi:MAG: ParB N-terminal domain-containing protein [Desulfovermiculus sp.]